MSNYPPGCSHDTYGAPWNEIEIEKEVTVVVKTTVHLSFPGPDKIDQEDINEAVKEQINEDFRKMDYDIEEIIID